MFKPALGGSEDVGDPRLHPAPFVTRHGHYTRTHNRRVQKHDITYREYLPLDLVHATCSCGSDIRETRKGILAFVRQHTGKPVRPDLPLRSGGYTALTMLRVPNGQVPDTDNPGRWPYGIAIESYLMEEARRQRLTRKQVAEMVFREDKPSFEHEHKRWDPSDNKLRSVGPLAVQEHCPICNVVFYLSEICVQTVSESAEAERMPPWVDGPGIVWAP